MTSDATTAAAPVVTYLIANHDHARYLPDCIASLRAQTDAAWRAILLDDASSDGSIDVIAPLLEPRIRLIVNTVNGGYIRALRRLIAEAETDIVAILDADDALAPEATARLRRAYAEDSSAAFVYSRFVVCDETLTREGAVHGSPVPEGGTVLSHGTIGHILSFRRSAYERTEGLDDGMLYAEDRDLVYKLEEIARPVIIDAVLYRYRQVPGSQSRDPGKREIGARSTRRARRAALRRRGVRGMRRAVWELLFLADYVSYSERYPGALRRAAALVARRTGAVAGRLGT